MTEYSGGAESGVNAYNNNLQSGPSVTALSSGGYLVTWASWGQDSDNSSGVYAQRYGAAGNKLGGEFRVNSYTAGDQWAQDASGLADGGFVIAWQSKDQDGSGYGIYSRRYDASGRPVGTEQRVNTNIAYDQVMPSVTGLRDGGYVVTWTVGDKDGSFVDVYSQLYTASGSPLRGEQRVNTTTESHQLSPSVSSRADGGYLVSWDSGSGIYAQRFDGFGRRLGEEVHVSPTGGNSDIASLEGGGFVVISQRPDSIHSRVFAQLFDANGLPVGGEIKVDADSAAESLFPSVSALKDGGFVVTWALHDQVATGGIFAQVFDSFGARTGGVRQVSSTTDKDYYTPSVTALENGNFVVAWRYTGDEHPGGIFARQFTPVASAVADGGNNSLSGTAAADTMDGGVGNDQIAGFAGSDVLAGGAGGDHLFGGSGDDILSADLMNSFDNLREVDLISGGAGDDMIFSGYGDIVDGGDGFDTVGLSYVGAIAGINGDTRVLHNGQALVAGAGTFQNVERFSDIALTSFDDRMVIGDQDDPAVVRSWEGNDYLIGQEVSITMYGGNGNDMLVGSTANDMLYGESGNDTLMGYLGNDHLWGGSGSDRFMVTHLKGTTHVEDFELGTDKLDVASIDANTSLLGDQAFTFIGLAGFSGAAGELRLQGSATAGYHAEGDVNGDGVADLLISLGPVQVGLGDLLL